MGPLIGDLEPFRIGLSSSLPSPWLNDSPPRLAGRSKNWTVDHGPGRTEIILDGGVHHFNIIDLPYIPTAGFVVLSGSLIDNSGYIIQRRHQISPYPTCHQRFSPKKRFLPKKSIKTALKNQRNPSQVNITNLNKKVNVGRTGARHRPPALVRRSTPLRSPKLRAVNGDPGPRADVSRTGDTAYDEDGMEEAFFYYWYEHSCPNESGYLVEQGSGSLTVV